MARGRRGRRSRSKQRSRGAGTRSSKAKSSKSRSRNTRGSGARKSTPSKRRNTRTTTRASNRRATVSKARRAAPKRATAPKKKAPTRRVTKTTNKRAEAAKKRRVAQAAPTKKVYKAPPKPATSKRQETRINRKSPVKASTAFNNALKAVQNRNLVADKRINAITNPRGALKEADAARKGIRQEVKNPGFLDSILNRNNELQKQINNLGSNVMNTVGNVANAALGIGPAAAQGRTLKDYEKNREEKIKERFPGASPNSAIFGMSDAQLNQPGGPFNQTGPGGPEPEADYTSYQSGSYYNQSDTNMNPTNFMRSARNVITTPARMVGINNRFTNMLIPKSNEAIQDARDQRGPRPTLKRRGGGGGASRIAQQVAATQMQPEIAPTIGTPAAEEYIESTTPQGDLTRIQSQAYNTALTSSLAGMFGGQGSVGYTPQGSPELSPTLRAGTSRGRRRVRMFGGRRRRGGTGDQFSRAGDRIAKLTNINI